MDEKIIAKGIFIKTKKVIRKLIDGSIIIIIVFSLLSGIVYWAVYGKIEMQKKGSKSA